MNLLPDNPVVAIALAVWLIMALGDKKEREKFVNTTFLLLTNPMRVDDYSSFKEAERAFKENSTKPFSLAIDKLIDGIEEISNKQLWKLVGHLMLLFFLLLFFTADAIVINSILEVIGLPPENLPEGLRLVLGQYGIAVAVGTFFSLIVGGFVLFESSGMGEFSNFRNYSGLAKRMVQIGGGLLLVSSLFVGISLGFGALKVTLSLPSWVDVMIQVSVNVLVRANVLIATLLILTEAIKGLRTIAIIAIGFAILLFCILYYVVSVTGSTLWLLFDSLWRILRWIIAIISFFVFTPLDNILFIPKIITNRIIGTIANTDGSAPANTEVKKDIATIPEIAGAISTLSKSDP